MFVLPAGNAQLHAEVEGLVTTRGHQVCIMTVIRAIVVGLLSHR